MKTYDVYLYYDPDCTRNWLAYLTRHNRWGTLCLRIEAQSGAQAKNRAVTDANHGFLEGVITEVNTDDPLWGVNAHPVLKKWTKIAKMLDQAFESQHKEPK